MQGKNYSQVVDYSFHISHATLVSERGSPSDFATSLVAVHAVVEDNDFTLCYLGQSPNVDLLRQTNSERPVIQQSLNLDVTAGEKISLYVDCMIGEENATTVHLTGFFCGSSSFSGLDDLHEACEVTAASPIVELIGP